MSLPPTSISRSTEELLRHAAWVRRVARALVVGADRVDDLEQETWVEALSHPPRHVGDWKSWLTAVTRNVARHLRRDESTRVHHEQRQIETVRASEASRNAPAAGEIVARAEIQQRVAAAVLALEEPYRSTLLARYMDELPPSEIARALDVSVDTVKTRLKRGLAQLRLSLDSLRPAGATLEAVLLPLCGPAVLATMPLGVKVLIAAAALAIGVSIFVSRPPQSPKSGGVVADSDVPSTATAPAGPVAPGPVVQDGASARRDPIAPPPPRSTFGSAERSSQATARIVGKLVLPDGRGAGGVELALNGTEADGERTLRFGLPKDWKPVEGSSREDGTFSLEFEAPRAFQFMLHGKLAGYAALDWRWLAIDPGAVEDIGAVALCRTGTIRGRIMDGSGKPILGPHEVVVAEEKGDVHGDSSQAPKSGSLDVLQPLKAYAVADATTGRFEIDDVAAGSIALSVESPLTGTVRGPLVEVRIGETTDADIVIAGPDLAHRVTVSLSTDPYFFFESGPDQLILSGNGIEPRRAVASTNTIGDFEFDDVPPGLHTVEIRDPRFLPWRRDDVQSNAAIHVALKGNASIQLRVVDATTGEPIPRYSLRTRLGGGVSPAMLELLRASDAPPADGKFEGLIPVDQDFIVIAAGFAEWSLAELPLPSDRTTAIEARLTKGTIVSGVVVRSDGITPCPGVHVFLESKASNSEADAASDGEATSSVEPRHDGSETVCDAIGRFDFKEVGAGHYELRTGEEDPELGARIDGVDVAEGASRVEGLRLVLPARGSLSGKLVLPEGVTCEGFDVVAVSEVESPEARASRRSLAFRRQSGAFKSGRSGAPESRYLHADGTYRIPALTPGPKRLLLLFPPVILQTANGRSSSGRGFEIELPRRADSEATKSATPPGPALAMVVGDKESNADFDARAVLGGRIHLTTRIDGAGPKGVVVEVVPAEPSDDPESPWFEIVRIGAGRPDARGELRISPVPPGRYRWSIHDLDTMFGGGRTWGWISPGVFEVHPDAETTETVSLALVPGELLVEDDSGQPVRNHGFEVGFVEASFELNRFSAVTDGAGRLRLRFVPGNYRIRSVDEDFSRDDGSPHEESWTQFEWTRSGPSVKSIRIAIGK